MNVPVILPISGVPDELIRVLNDRFRQLSGSSSSSGDTFATFRRSTFGQGAPNLSRNDAGFLWEVSDYGHLFVWNGSDWEFADEEGGYIAGRVAAPTKPGWQLCDGTATKYLKIVNGAPVEVSFTTPNLSGSPRYLKMGAAYTGTLNTAVVPTTAGSTSTSPGGAGAAVAANGHTHTISLPGDPVANLIVLPYFRR